MRQLRKPFQGIALGLTSIDIIKKYFIAIFSLIFMCNSFASEVSGGQIEDEQQVSLQELLKYHDKYEGKRLTVVGIFIFGYPNSALAYDVNGYLTLTSAAIVPPSPYGAEVRISSYIRDHVQEIGKKREIDRIADMSGALVVIRGNFHTEHSFIRPRFLVLDNIESIELAPK